MGYKPSQYELFLDHLDDACSISGMVAQKIYTGSKVFKPVHFDPGCV